MYNIRALYEHFMINNKSLTSKIVKVACKTLDYIL